MDRLEFKRVKACHIHLAGEQGGCRVGRRRHDNRVEILAKAGVHRDLEAKGVYLGAPAVDRREALKQFHLPKSVETLQKEVAALKAKLAELEKGLNA